MILNNKYEVEYGSDIKLLPVQKPSGVPTTLKYSVEDSSILTISENGLVTTLKAGTTKVNVEAECVTKSITIEVLRNILESEEVSFLVNSKYKLTDSKYKNMKWESGDEKIANVINGKIVGKKVGSVTLTGRNDFNEIKIKVNVLKEPKYILGNLITIQENEEYDFVKNNEMLKNSKFHWITSDSTIATIDENGKVKALKAGHVKIIAKNNDLLFENFIIIKAKSTTKIVNREDLNISDVSQMQLPNKPTENDLKWSSSDENIVKVEENGNITTVGYGTAIITAKSEKIEYVNQINVYEKLENQNNKNVTILKNDNLIAKNTVLNVTELSEFDSNYEQVSKKELGLSKYKMYDITLMLGDAEIQPNGEIIVEFEIPKEYDLNRIVVYRVEHDNTYTKLDRKILNEKIQIKTDHFSHYIIGEESKDESSIVNPQTGIFISLGVILVGGLVAGTIHFYTKKKRKFIRL